MIIIPFLLHHVNRSCKWPEFYRIKDEILQNHGTLVNYDVQHFEGKKCHSCNGTGIYKKYYNGMWHREGCWHCINGWYKQETWVLLAKMQLGKYYFHIPTNRAYGSQNPFSGFKIIDGYIEHDYERYHFIACLIFFMIYDKHLAKRYFSEMGIGWRTYWWYPMNWLYVIAHFVHHGRNAYPLRNLKEWWSNKFRKQEPEEPSTDLPF